MTSIDQDKSMNERLKNERGGEDSASRVRGKLSSLVRRMFERVDSWASDITEKPRMESGWYLHTGEGKALAAGAEARAGKEEEIATMLDSKSSQLAMRAIAQVDLQSGADYKDYLKAVAIKYKELLDKEKVDDKQSN